MLQEREHKEKYKPLVSNTLVTVERTQGAIKAYCLEIHSPQEKRQHREQYKPVILPSDTLTTRQRPQGAVQAPNTIHRYVHLPQERVHRE